MLSCSDAKNCAFACSRLSVYTAAQNIPNNGAPNAKRTRTEEPAAAFPTATAGPTAGHVLARDATHSGPHRSLGTASMTVQPREGLREAPAPPSVDMRVGVLSAASDAVASTGMRSARAQLSSQSPSAADALPVSSFSSVPFSSFSSSSSSAPTSLPSLAPTPTPTGTPAPEPAPTVAESEMEMEGAALVADAEPDAEDADTSEQGNLWSF